ncbi:MAG TPA: hypothetical protein VNB64_13540 [Solirubrobacteraceae bacterium]|nr:hypothetical protein [Solirubrobacteraceae bacterium]
MTDDLGFAPPSGEGFADAVTVSWGDPSSDVFGFARIGVADGASTSALGVLFSGNDVIESVAEGDLALAASDWSSVRAGPLSISTLAPDDSTASPRERWRLEWDGAAELELTAFSPPLSVAGGGMEGHEKVCRVSGTAGGRKVAGLGQRGRSWGVADWDRIGLARSLSAWWDDRAVVLSALRPAKAKDHAHEELAAWLFEADAGAAAVAEPRLSTTYDGEGRQRRAGLELFLTGDDDEFPRRAAGEVACGTSLDLGRLRLDCAFFHWRMDGAAGVGRYDVLRRA